MYDQSLGASLGYGDISSTNNPRRGGGGFGGWRRRERQLDPSQPLYPEDTPTNGQSNLNNAIIKQSPPVTQVPHSQGPMGAIYKGQEKFSGQLPLSPLQQTGYQQRFFNPQGTDNVAPQTSTPDASTNLANAITKQGRGFTNAQGAWGNFDYTPGTVGQYASQLEGFDQSKLDPSHPDNNSLKYIFATAASNVDVNDPQAGAKVVAELQRMGINATLEGSYGDRIRFPTGESVDVIRNSQRVGGDPNATLGWQWIDATYDGQAAPGQTGGMGGDLSPMLSALLGGDGSGLQNIDPTNPYLAQILAVLAQQNQVG